MPINSTKWELLESSPDDGGLTIFNDCDAICEHIADPAIGRVFLAAPDMLAALKALLQIIEDARGDDEFDANTCDAGGVIFGDIASEAVEASRAAIAKAEGAA